MVFILQKNIKEFQPKQEMELQLKSAIIVQCDKRFCSIECCSLLGMATILDSRLKRVCLRPRCIIQDAEVYPMRSNKHRP